MFGRNVKVKLNDDIEVSVFVFCTPDTPDDELLRRALNQLETMIQSKRNELFANLIMKELFRGK